LGALLLMRKASASARRTVLVAAFVAVLALPFASRALSGSRAAVEVPVAVHAVLDPAFDAKPVEPVVVRADTSSTPAAGVGSLAFRPSLAQGLVTLWAPPAFLVL